MRIFGWTITRAAPAQARAERNAAAMTGSVGAAALPGTPTAARIHREEIPLAITILRAAKEYSHRSAGADLRPDALAAALRQRLGAAAAVETAVEAAPQSAPILREEIKLLQRAVGVLSKLLSPPALVPRGRALLDDLHTRLGHAVAIEHLGDVVAITPPRAALPAHDHGATAR